MRTLRGRRMSRSEASMKSSLPITTQKAARRASVLMRCEAASFSSSAPPRPLSPSKAATATPPVRGCKLSVSAALGSHHRPYSRVAHIGARHQQK